MTRFGTTSLVGMYVTMIPFYFATWEEYFLDEMVLPVVNGPTEGILFCVGMGKLFIISCACMWTEDTPTDRDLLFLYLFVSSAFQGSCRFCMALVSGTPRSLSTSLIHSRFQDLPSPQ